MQTTEKLKTNLSNFIRNSDTLYSLARKWQEWQYLAKYKRYYEGFNHLKNTSLREIHIEPVNYCNLRCSFCALDHAAPKQRMAPEVLENLLSQWLRDIRFEGLEWIHLHNGGESLLHPKFGELLEIINTYKQKALRWNRRFPKVSLLTNATVLTEAKRKMLLEHNAVDLYRFSVDGGSAEAFESYRLRAKWYEVSGNIYSFLNEKKKVAPRADTGIICLVPNNKPLNHSWMDLEFVKLLNKVDTVEYRHAHGWAGDLDAETKFLSEKKGCTMLMESLVILPNGDVTVCCADLNGKGVVGNIMNDTLFELYIKPKRLEMLKKMAVGKRKEIDLCADCESF